MKNIFVILLFVFLSACSGKRLDVAEDNHKFSYGGYLVAQSECSENNKNKIEVPQTEGDPIKIEFVAPGCEKINPPKHGGEYIAKIQEAYIKGGATIIGAAVQGAYSYATNKDNNETRVELSEIENDVLVTAIESSQQSAQAASDAAISAVEQSARITELVIGLTEGVINSEEETEDFDF